VEIWQDKPSGAALQRPIQEARETEKAAPSAGLPQNVGYVMKVHAVMCEQYYCQQQSACKNRKGCHLAYDRSGKESRMPAGEWRKTNLRPQVAFICSEYEFDEKVIEYE
jgi:hypothetical protein